MPSSHRLNETIASKCECSSSDQIEFPGYTYNYEFDHTVKSTAFLDFK